MKKLSGVPKKSFAAAACIALLLLRQLWVTVPWLVMSRPLSPGSPLPLANTLLSLVAALLGIALSVWLLAPNNRRYKLGLKVILGLTVAQAVVSVLAPITISSFYRANIGRTAISLLNLLLSAFAILLFGALAKKSTEKLAALAMAVWYLWAFSQNMTQYWIPMGRDPDIAGGALAYMIVHSIATSVLPALLWAAALWLHPVLTRAMLEKTMIEEGQAHE